MPSLGIFAAGVMVLLAVAIIAYLFLHEIDRDDFHDGPWAFILAFGLAICGTSLDARPAQEGGSCKPNCVHAEEGVLPGEVQSPAGAVPQDPSPAAAHARKVLLSRFGVTRVAQPVERQALTLEAAGSTPAPGAISPVETIADKAVADLGWIGFGTSLDLGMTSLALRRCPDCREGNPLGWDSEARIALKLTTGIGAGTTCWWLRRHGHDKAATILRWTAFGIQAVAAGNNAVHAIRRK